VLLNLPVPPPGAPAPFAVAAAAVQPPLMWEIENDGLTNCIRYRLLPNLNNAAHQAFLTHWLNETLP
jgi:hypothetical protein